MDHFRLDALRRAIREHLAQHGSSNWKLIADRFKDVPHATFWRTVKSVKAEGAHPANKAEVPDVDPAKQAWALFPAYCQPVRKLAEYQELIGSAQELIDQAKGPTGRIKNWQMHAKGVALRESLVQSQVQVMYELASLETQNSLFEAVVDLARELPPEFQKSFVTRFNELRHSREKER